MFWHGFCPNYTLVWQMPCRMTTHVFLLVPQLHIGLKHTSPYDYTCVFHLVPQLHISLKETSPYDYTCVFHLVPPTTHWFERNLTIWVHMCLSPCEKTNLLAIPLNIMEFFRRKCLESWHIPPANFACSTIFSQQNNFHWCLKSYKYFFLSNFVNSKFKSSPRTSLHIIQVSAINEGTCK